MPHSKPPSGKRMVFWPHPDQYEIITAALDEAKKAVSTEHQTVALEVIAQAYMATGIAFKTWNDALTYAAKDASDKSVFVGNVVTLLKALCPELTISAGIELKGGAVSDAPQGAPEAAT
jgi:hypothetical protein